MLFFQESEETPGEEIMWLTTADAASLGAEEVAARLHVDLRTGLWWQEAEQRRQLAGYNELCLKEEEPTWKKYVEQVNYSIVQFVISLHCSFINNLIQNKVAIVVYFILIWYKCLYCPVYTHI